MDSASSAVRFAEESVMIFNISVFLFLFNIYLLDIPSENTADVFQFLIIQTLFKHFGYISSVTVFLVIVLCEFIRDRQSVTAFIVSLRFDKVSFFDKGAHLVRGIRGGDIKVICEFGYGRIAEQVYDFRAEVFRCGQWTGSFADDPEYVLVKSEPELVVYDLEIPFDVFFDLGFIAFKLL